MSFNKLGEYPNTSMWGKSLISDVNKTLNDIDAHITKGIDSLKISLKNYISNAIIDGIVKK